VEHEGTRFIREFIQFEGEKSHESRAPHPKSSFESWTWPNRAEEQLIDRGLKATRRALDALFARNTRALYQTALRVLGNRRTRRSSAGRAAFRVSQSAKVRAPFAVLDLADADRHQRSIDAPPCSKRSVRQFRWMTGRPRGELPLAERFADESPNPEQIYGPGPKLRERVGKKLSEISPLLRTAFWLREIEDSPPRKRHTR